MAKSKWNMWIKVRSALRDIYRYSPMRREAIKAACVDSGGIKAFTCPLCARNWPIQMADVDHIDPCGSLLCPADLHEFFNRLMYGKVRVICKLCHKKVTAAQRGKRAKK